MSTIAFIATVWLDARCRIGTGGSTSKSPEDEMQEGTGVCSLDLDSMLVGIQLSVAGQAAGALDRQYL